MRRGALSMLSCRHGPGCVAPPSRRLHVVLRNDFMVRSHGVQSWLPMAEPVRGSSRFALAQKRLGPIEYLAIGNAGALVLAQVLEPRFVHEAFQETIRLRGFVKELPEIRAVAVAHFPDVLHRGDELAVF